jgi:hypothetical protein
MALTAEISALTQKYLIPKLVDNIFASNAALQRAKKRGWYDTIDGGTQITQPLAYATTTSAGRYSGSATLLTDDNQQVTDAIWDWKQYYASIQINRIDELKNAGKSAIINHLKSKVQMAEKTLKDVLGTDLFGDGTTTNSFEGLKMICAITGTHGTIAKGTYSWWQAHVDSTTTALAPSSLQALIGDCTIDADRPTVIFCTQDSFDDLWAAIQPQQRFADEETLKAGFINLIFNGIPVVVDSHVSSGYLYTVNENYLQLLAHKDENFRFTGFRQPVNQNVKVAQVFWTGAMTSSNNRMHGMMTALT